MRKEGRREKRGINSKFKLLEMNQRRSQEMLEENLFSQKFPFYDGRACVNRNNRFPND